MAENLLSSAASAVTGELTRVLFTGLMGKLDRKAAAADKKLRRLDMLLIKINSAIEASEKHAIQNASLVEWRDRLKEGAAEGGEVLASFRQREAEAAARAQAQATGDGDAAQQQHQHLQEEPSSSSSSSTASATAIAGNNSAPSGMPQGQGIFIFRATKTLLFSNEEDMERLNDAVERLEDLSRGLYFFIKLLKLEILAPASAPAPAPALFWTQNRSGGSSRVLNPRSPSSCKSTAEDSPSSKTFVSRMTGEAMLLVRLEEALARICKIVALADGRDLRGYEWLACWASIFREAKWQGRAVLGGAISTIAVDGDEVARCDDQEGFELGSFVRDMQSLVAREEAESFSDLACLCPTAVALAS